MGISNSKAEKIEALRLCKERRRFIKQAIDSRYNLAAAHVSYIESLRNIGVALRRFAEAEVLIESSLSTSATEIDKTPSHSSYPSPSPSHLGAEVSDSPLHNEAAVSPPVANLTLMRTESSAPVTFTINPSNGGYMEEDSGMGMGMGLPVPPPPPPFEAGSSWDYFDPNDCESFRFVGPNEADLDFEYTRGWGEFRGQGIKTSNVMELGKQNSAKCSTRRTDKNPKLELNSQSKSVSSRDGNGSREEALDGEVKQLEMGHNADGLAEEAALEKFDSKGEETKDKEDKDLPSEREDPSEFITHRAKDFLSSIKDIEHRFFRASEAGREVSRMLESNKIRVGYSEAKGRSSATAFLQTFRLVCCKRTALVSHEPVNHVTKIITWKRTTSSRSSSSRNALATKDDADDSGSDFMEEFCMIAGSHSSTLDRLYAWERKLYDEVKASESIRKEYEQKCDQLKHQFAKDHAAPMIDKTRAVVKDLHSRIRVALHSVDSIAKRIEKMRDEELQPQLSELIQGLIRMWKEMLECHHAQYITISLAYHSRSASGTPQGDTRKQIMAQLQQEFECFGLSFADWVNSHASYVEALNGWLQNCILPSQERRNRRSSPFSPRRVVTPPIFDLCQDWSAGIKALPSEELTNSIKDFLSDLSELIEQQAEEHPKKEKPEPDDAENAESDGNEQNDGLSSNLCCLHTSLTKVLDRLNKFSEGSLKMYEDVRQRSEAARVKYSKCKPAKY